MNRSETVWIVDDDRSIRWVLEKALQQGGIATQSFDSADGLLGRLSRQQPDVIISDIRWTCWRRFASSTRACR